jgi:hypothetical protein
VSAVRGVARLGLACLGLACPVLVPGCTRPEAGTQAGPRLTVRWTGADTAEFGAAATAERCDTLHLIEIRAISGDTGVGLVLYDSGTVGSGTYPIRHPENADSLPPAAALGLRWFSKTSVQGFQGASGEVAVRRSAAGELSGTFTAQARALSGPGKLELTGSFDALRPRPATRGCAPPPPGDSTATSGDAAARSRDSTAVVD